MHGLLICSHAYIHSACTMHAKNDNDIDSTFVHTGGISFVLPNKIKIHVVVKLAAIWFLSLLSVLRCLNSQNGCVLMMVISRT